MSLPNNTKKLDTLKCEIWVKYLCLALFNNPVFVTKACRYFISQTKLPGFRCKIQKGSSFPLSNSYLANSRHGVFSNLAPIDVSTETIDDAMRLINQSIISEAWGPKPNNNNNSTGASDDNIPQQVIQMSTDLTLNQLIKRVLSTLGNIKNDHEKHIYYDSDTMILPEIAIFIIEHLIPVLDFRIIYHKKPIPTDTKLVAAGWFHWLSHAYLGIPHTLFKENKFIARALHGILPYTHKIFSQHAVHPHASVGTPLYYEHFKYNHTILNEYFDGWYWVLTYLELLSRLVVASCYVKNSNDINKQQQNVSFVSFLVHRRWFLETLSAIIFVVRKDIYYLNKNSIRLNECIIDQDNKEDCNWLIKLSTETLNYTIESDDKFLKYLEEQEWISFDQNVNDDTSNIQQINKDKLDVGVHPVDHVLYKAWQLGTAFIFWDVVIQKQLNHALRAYIENVVIKKWPL